MGAERKANLREMANAAYQMAAGVLQGKIQRHPQSGEWMVGEQRLDAWLEKYAEQEVYVIVASLDQEQPLPQRVCRTCGTEYSSFECPQCRTARIRLRGG